MYQKFSTDFDKKQHVSVVQKCVHRQVCDWCLSKNTTNMIQSTDQTKTATYAVTS